LVHGGGSDGGGSGEDGGDVTPDGTPRLDGFGLDAGPARLDGGEGPIDGGEPTLDGAMGVDGGPSCVPAGEACNATDDDCDESIDEDTCAGCIRSLHAGSVYLACSAIRTLDEARADCTEWGYDLVVIDDMAENDIVRAQAAGLGDVWIGLDDRTTEGTFVWVDGRVQRRGAAIVLYDHFRPGEPAGGAGNHCVELDTADSGYWNDVGCDSAKPYVCEARP
jgi:hypothetical protein